MFITFLIMHLVGVLQPKLNGESFKITFEAPRRKVLTLLCFLWRNTSVANFELVILF